MSQYVLLGKVSGFFGVKGWVKLYSYTRPKESINQYSQFYLDDKDGAKKLDFTEIKSSGKHIIGKLKGIDDRDSAEAFLDVSLYVNVEDLPELENEFYWYQLVGLTVVNKSQQVIGSVESMMETGANDVLVVKGERNLEILIPYVWDNYVLSVDLSSSTMIVDWEIEG